MHYLEDTSISKLITLIKTAIKNVDKLPVVTSSDNDKFLCVVDGSWAVASIPDTEGAVTASYTVTIPTSGWSGSSAPYTNAVTVSGITAADKPIIDIVHSSTYSSVAAEREGWAAIYKAVTAANRVTFYATDKPTVALNVQIMAVRK